MSKVGEMNIPITHFERNLLFTKKEITANYKLDLSPYAFKSLPEKKAILNKLQDLLWIFRGQGQFILASKQLSVDELMNASHDLQYSNDFPEEYELLNTQVKQRFTENRPWTKVLYISLNLPKIQDDLPEFEMNSLSELKKVFSWGLRTLSDTAIDFIRQHKQIEEEHLQTAIHFEDSLFHSLREVGITRCTPRESEWLCKKGFFRGLSEPQLTIQKRMPTSFVERNGKTYLKPRLSTIQNIFGDAIIQEKFNSLAIHHGEPGEGDTSHQAFLALVDAPEDIHIVGKEWLYWLFSFDYPVDVSMKFVVSDPVKEQKDLAKKRKDLKGDAKTKLEDQQEISEIDEEVMAQGRKLETKFAKGMPLVYFQTILCVSADSKKLLEERVKDVQSFYSPRRFKFSRVRGSNAVLDAFKDFIPGGKLNEYWKIPCDPSYIAASGLHCSNVVGDPAGPYLGDTIHGFPVLYDMGRPMRKPLDRAGTVVILGTLGGGKSVTKKKLVKQALLSGGIVFSVDPKGEDHCFEKYPEIKEKMKVLKFQPGETTELPVFRLSKIPERAWQIAKDFLMYLLNGMKSEYRGYVISKAVEMTMAHDKPSMYVFLDMMKKIEKDDSEEDISREARFVTKLLEQYQKDPMSRVIFNDDADDLSLDQYQLVVASLKGLSLPKRVRKGQEGAGMKHENMNDSQRISVGIMYLVAALGREMLMNKPTEQLGVFSGDEVWMLTQIQQGDELIQDIVKLGRSMNIVPILATQEASDVDSPEIRNNVGIVFAFRMNDKAEIDGALDLLKVSNREEWIYQRFRDLESGTCFYKDIEGRVQQISVYVAPRDMEVFDTSVKLGKKENEEDVHHVA